MSKIEPEIVKRRPEFVYFASTSVNLLAVVSGFGFGWPSPFIPKLNGKIDAENNPLSEPTTLIQDSWIASILLLGAMAGQIFAGSVCKWIGKKKTFLLFNVAFIISNVILYFARTVLHFYMARFLCGLGMGCVFSFIPIYVAEISEVNDRSATSIIISLLTSGSQLFTFVVGPYVTVGVFALISLVPSILFIITFGIFVPESPYQLVFSEKLEKAEKALIKLRRTNDVEQELTEISNDIANISEEQSFLSLLKSPLIKKCLQISIGLAFFQQFCGILPVLFYQQSIFDITKGPISGEASVMLVGLIQFFTICLVTFIVNHIGRKKLMLLSYTGMLISLVSLGLYFFLWNKGYDVSIASSLPVITICSFIFWFNLGAGPITWTLAGEIFPTNVKSLFSSLTAFGTLFFGFFLSLSFPTLSLYLGMAGSMWFFCLFIAGGIAFSAFCLIETKGKSFTEIQDMLQETIK